MALENRFAGGLNTDIDDAYVPQHQYRDAVNLELTDDNGYHALRNYKGTDLLYRFPIVSSQQVPWAIDSDFGDSGEVDREAIISAFECTAKYINNETGQEYYSPSVVVFTYFYDGGYNPSTPVAAGLTGNNIYILNPATGRIHLVFSGYLGMLPNISGDTSRIREVDAYSSEEEGENYCYWIDYEHPLRRIRLYVSDDKRYNCAVHPHSPLSDAIPSAYLADEDVLSVFKLFPPDAVDIDGIVPEKGNLPAGSYQIAYRYYNTKNNTFSKFSLFTNPIPVISSVTNNDSSSGDHLNDINGDTPGSITHKAIRIKILPHPTTGSFSRMSNYFNAVQFAIIKNTTGQIQRQQTVYLLEPSRTVYNTKEFLYTGTEMEIADVATSITIDEAPISTAKTIEHIDGRMFLANVKYRINKAEPTIASAKTKQKFLRVHADPMKSVAVNADGLPDQGDFINSAYGYYSEENCYKYRGYWRGELYRWLTTYGDKYGNFSEPSIIDFSNIVGRAVPTPSAGTGTDIVSAGASFTVTKVFVGTGGGLQIFARCDINGNRAFIHAHVPTLVSETVNILGGYFLDFSKKIYSGTTFTLSLPPLTVGVSYTIMSGSVNVAQVNGLLNWADPSSKDWKFPPRNDPAGHLFDNEVFDGNVHDYIRVFGLELSGISNHPTWAVCMAVLRLERKKNILGQSPVVHTAAAQGIPTMWNKAWGRDPFAEQPANNLSSWGYGDDQIPSDFNPDFRVQQGRYDYNGSEDTLMPRILAYGPTRHLTAFRFTFWESQGGNGYDFGPFLNDWVVLWNKAEPVPGLDPAVSSYAPAFNTYFLYPPEYMAQWNGQTRDSIFLDGTEYLDAIDTVSLSGFSAVRNGPDFSLAPDDNNFYKGDFAEYVWIFAPTDFDSYFYSNVRSHHYNNSLPSKIASIPDTSLNPLLVKRGYKLGYGHSPVILDDSYVRRDGYFVGNTAYNTTSFSQNYREIRKLNNEFNLVKHMMEKVTEASNVRQSFVVPPFPAINQRAIFAIMEDRDGRFIYDPTDAIDQTQFSEYFGSSLDLTSGINRQLEKEQGHPATSDVILPDLMKGHYVHASGDFKMVSGDGNVYPYQVMFAHQWFDNNFIMTPGNCILLPVVNIVKRMDDFRYGTRDTSNVAIFTGAYQAIDHTVDNGLTLEVFGGDCYISRFPVTVRDNAIAARGMALRDEFRYSVVNGGGDPDDPDDQTIILDAINKPQNYSQFVEIIDMWLESEINGHYIDNEDNLYPYRVRERHADGEWADNRGGAQSKFQYPNVTSMKMYITPRAYNYNHGYSIENNIKTFVSLPEDFPRQDKLTSRVHFSKKKVRNTLTRGFDSWLVDDFYDGLDPAYGPITKLEYLMESRLLSVQERGIASLLVGAVQSYDADGNSISLSSGSVIGDHGYISTQSGSKYLSSIKKIDNVVYYLDSVNSSVNAVSGSVADLSKGKVWTLAKSMFGGDVESRTYGNIVGLVDTIGKKYCAYNNSNVLFFTGPIPYDKTEGLVYNAQIGVFESRIKSPALFPEDDIQVSQVAYVNRVSAGTRLYEVINKWADIGGGGAVSLAANGEIHTFTNSNRSLMFGGNKESSLRLLVNHSVNTRKTFNVIYINGKNMSVGSPGRTTVHMRVPNDLAGQPDQETVEMPILANRENMYITNPIRDAIRGSRLRGLYAETSVTFSTSGQPEPNEIVVRSIITKSRTSYREIQ